VEKNVRYHSSQKTPDLFIATNVSKFTNHKNVVVALDLVEDRAMVEMTEVLDLVEDRAMVEMTEVLDLVEVQEAAEQERCLPRPVVTVEKNVRYHSSQKVTDLFIATNVSKITNHKNVVVALDLVEDRAMVEMTEVLDLVEVQETTEQERCLPRPVVTVEKNAKYHSNQKAADLSIATNVSKITNKIRNSLSSRILD